MANPKVLIIEDESITALAIKAALVQHMFQVTDMVTTGSRAVESVRAEKPDYIISDIRLAGDWDGIRTMHELKKNYDIPFVFITGYPVQMLEEEIDKLTPLAVFKKPFRMYEIIDSLLK